MKVYIAPQIEIVETLDIVTTSSEVETEKIPFASVDDMGSYQL
jgi:hypothetical protein